MRKLFLISLITIFGAFITTVWLIPIKAEEKDSPHISISESSYDFGKVEEGIKIRHTFKVTNTGKSLLKIDRAYASCGCTIPTLQKSELAPAESCNLNVIVDTSMKQKAVTKTVFISSNDPVNAVITIQLSMFVKDPHSNMHGDVGVKIFQDAHCASCHVNRGTNLIGVRLYEADCAMCHGTWGKGAVGPALTGPYENAEFAKGINKVISYGSPTHHSMPGFLDKTGGPLNQYQIDSIVEYLALISKTVKK